MPLDPQLPQGKLQSVLRQAHVSLVLWANTAVLGMEVLSTSPLPALNIALRLGEI